jgi:hypothetical protein
MTAEQAERLGCLFIYAPPAETEADTRVPQLIGVLGYGWG